MGQHFPLERFAFQSFTDGGNLRVMELCKKLADALAVYALSLPESTQRDAYRKFVERWQVGCNRKVILKDAASVYPVKLTDFDSKPYLFNCKNGTLDLRTRDFHPHDPGDMLATISGVKYDPDACSDLWQRTVSDVMQQGFDSASPKSVGLWLDW